MLSAADTSIQDVLRYFTQRGIEVALLVPTATGMRKSIMDATAPVRLFLKEAGIHDFDKQPQGQGHKRLVPTSIITCSGIYRTATSLYRPVTKQGDPRIWVQGLSGYADPRNVLALVATADCELIVINASSPGLVPGIRVAEDKNALEIRDTPCIDLDATLAPMLHWHNEVAEELLALIRGIAGRWHNGKPGEKRDLEVGRLLEELLGIKANSSKAPDYKGIELKASRRTRSTRQTLFAKVPDWSISHCKSSAEILDVFGYERNMKYLRQLRCTVSAKGPNSQGLFLALEGASNRLLEASSLPSYPKVAYWEMEALQKALLTKHRETFWVSAACKQATGYQIFKYEHVLHTRAPMASALPTLLELGTITVDHLIARDLNGRVSERGPLFKIGRKDFDLLFPPGTLYSL